MKANASGVYRVPNKPVTYRLKRKLKALKVECAVLYDDPDDGRYGQTGTANFYLYGYQRYIPESRLYMWVRKQYHVDGLQVIKVTSIRRMVMDYEMGMSDFIQHAELVNEKEEEDN